MVILVIPASCGNTSGPRSWRDKVIKAQVLDRRLQRDKFQIGKMQTAEYRVLTK
jgi:hypothetical protein